MYYSKDIYVHVWLGKFDLTMLGGMTTAVITPNMDFTEIKLTVN